MQTHDIALVLFALSLVIVHFLRTKTYRSRMMGGTVCDLSQKGGRVEYVNKCMQDPFIMFYHKVFFFSFRLELIPRRRGVSHSDPLPPHVSSPGVIWFQVEKFQVLLNHVHPSLLLPSSAAKSLYFWLLSQGRTIQISGQVLDHWGVERRNWSWLI